MGELPRGLSLYLYRSSVFGLPPERFFLSASLHEFVKASGHSKRYWISCKPGEQSNYDSPYYKRSDNITAYRKNPLKISYERTEIKMPSIGSHLGGNLGQSYYGVDNSALLVNLPVRLGQIGSVMRGDQFWYLGGLHANALSPWLAGIAVLACLFSRAGRRELLLPLLLVVLAVSASLFTVSDLFVTHYALLQPLLVGLVGISLARLYEQARSWRGPVLLLPVAFLVLWLGSDLRASLAYHQDLTRSGGLADHSDASYHLAYHLRYNGLGAPVALDWGLDAPVRYLSEGTVTPIELFGYDSLASPDADFAGRLVPFFDNPDNVYLLHAAGQEIFAGRREAFFAQARLHGRQPNLSATFAQRDGTALVELWWLR